MIRYIDGQGSVFVAALFAPLGHIGAVRGVDVYKSESAGRVQMMTILEEAVAGRATIVPWTVEQYHRAIEIGFVPEDASVELLDGFIVHKDRAGAREDPMTIDGLPESCEFRHCRTRIHPE